MKSTFTKEQAIKDLHNLCLWFSDTVEEIREADSHDPIIEDHSVEDTIEFFDWAVVKLKGAIKMFQ